MIELSIHTILCNSKKWNTVRGNHRNVHLHSHFELSRIKTRPFVEKLIVVDGIKESIFHFILWWDISMEIKEEKKKGYKMYTDENIQVYIETYFEYTIHEETTVVSEVFTIGEKIEVICKFFSLPTYTALIHY